MARRAIIIGAGPAGLTAAYELLKRTDIQPIVLEKSEYIGGISRTIDYKGNRMDMGPHRFFSKSDRVMEWWLNIMPLEDNTDQSFTISYQNKARKIHREDLTSRKPEKDADKKMLIIQRLTRIYFLKRFFAYPIQLTSKTLKILGLKKTIRILWSFFMARLFPRKPVTTLEDFIINQFGRELYLLFFKDYTEKVWGVPCHEISAEWGAQRIKGLSLSGAISQAVKSLIKKKNSSDIGQKDKETSLIEQFLYPKYGPGSLWEEVARQVEEMGGKIYLNQDVKKLEIHDNQITCVHTQNSVTLETGVWEGNYFFSTMPVQELIADLGAEVPREVQEVAAGLQYRDFINVGVLLKQLSTPGKTVGQFEKLVLKDNWIYIQESDVKVGRLMIYNNWGGGMIKDENTVWIGMEYFCNTEDTFWAQNDETIRTQAILELEKMGLARKDDVLDSTVRRMEKTYPAYFGTYKDFFKIREYTDQISNLFLVGRNGMHKYNNADHSMLTAMVAVDNIHAGVVTKDNLWAINTEQEYHEEKKVPNVISTPRKEQPAIADFVHYIWRNRWSRLYCLLALAVFILQFIFFKYHYPYANYMPDSYYYLEAAYANADVNMWPVAYSKFLRLVSVFTHSDMLVVAFQYLFMQLGGLIFLFSLDYFLRPGKTVKYMLFIFFLLNPIPLYVSNYISADALFIGLSLLWFSTLLWIIYRPARWQIIVQGLLLLGCFTVRYNAIYYPLLGALAFALSRQRWQYKLAGIGFGLLLVLASYSYTSRKMEDVTGHRQFSAFGGWQLANNALYMYQHIPARERAPIPTRFANLEKMVRQHMDTLQKVKFSREDSVNSYFYLWSGRGPLIQYLNQQWKKDSTTPYFTRWSSEGPLYFQYAIYLMRTYPWTYLQTFVASNSIKLVVPPAEFLGTYNMGADSVGRLAKDWFQYKSQKVKDHNKKEGQIVMTQWYPIFSVLVNLLLLIHIVGLFVFGSLKRQKTVLPRLLALSLTLWLLNGCFSIFASPIVLRYQVFPILILFCMALLVGDIIYRPESNQKNQCI
ncbi:MAG: NAD(P)-binding protein [Chitinophagaceae bacterium]|nr:NAD(P)-binding protein [Chitinophagaceae bacterium]